MPPLLVWMATYFDIYRWGQEERLLSVRTHNRRSSRNSLVTFRNVCLISLHESGQLTPLGSVTKRDDHKVTYIYLCYERIFAVSLSGVHFAFKDRDFLVAMTAFTNIRIDEYVAPKLGKYHRLMLISQVMISRAILRLLLNMHGRWLKVATCSTSEKKDSLLYAARLSTLFEWRFMCERFALQDIFGLSHLRHGNNGRHYGPMVIVMQRPTDRRSSLSPIGIKDRVIIQIRRENSLRNSATVALISHSSFCRDTNWIFRINYPPVKEWE